MHALLCIIINLSFFINCILWVPVNTKIFQLKWSTDRPLHYKGFIYTDSNVVVTNPILQIELNNGEEICNFVVWEVTDKTTAKVRTKETADHRHQHSHQQQQPHMTSQIFRGIVKSAHLGLGEIQTYPNVTSSDLERLTNAGNNQEDQGNQIIILAVEAEACHVPELWSAPAFVMLKVLSPAKPVWSKSMYTFTVDADVPELTVIGKVNATTSSNSAMQEYIGFKTKNKICRYRIQEPKNSGFVVDINGIIITQQPIVLTETERTKTLLVSAEDCSTPIRRMSEVHVYIKIQSTCQIGWTGLTKVVNYSAHTGISPLGTNIRFDMCPDLYNSNPARVDDVSQCLQQQHKSKTRITVSIDLNIRSEKEETAVERNNEKESCSLDNESIMLQEDICDIDKNTSIRLLANLLFKNIGIVEFPTDPNIFPLASIHTPNKFSLYFWIRRDLPNTTMYQTILAEINDFGDELLVLEIAACNIRISTLIMMTTGQNEDRLQKILYQHEYETIDICDRYWHLVMILVNRVHDHTNNLPEINLLIDGKLLPVNVVRPKEMDKINRPMLYEESRSDIFIGQYPGCNYQQRFKGLLAGVVLLPNQLIQQPLTTMDVDESSSVPNRLSARASAAASMAIAVSKCLQQCTERLHFSALAEMSPGMSVSLNSEMKTIIINGHTLREVGRLLSLIGYVNPDHQLNWKESDKKTVAREILLKTEIKCRGYELPVASNRIHINLTDSMYKSVAMQQIHLNLKSDTSVIRIPNQMYVNYQSKDVGTAVFGNVTITAQELPLKSKDRVKEVSTTMTKCIITITPSLQARKEYLTWPQDTVSLIRSRHRFIDVVNDTNSLVMYGPHNQAVYQFIIQNIRYVTETDKKLKRYSQKVFSLQCMSSHKSNTTFNSNSVSVKVIKWQQNRFRQQQQQQQQEQQTQHQGQLKQPPILSRITENNSRLHRPRNNRDVDLHGNRRNPSPIPNSKLSFSKSNMAKLRETKQQNKENKKYSAATYVFLFFGITVFICTIFLVSRRLKSSSQFMKPVTGGGFLVPHTVVDYVCLPFQSLRQRFCRHYNSTVKVELSRDFANRINHRIHNEFEKNRRLDIGLRMQWDDSELNESRDRFNIITNPLYQNCVNHVNRRSSLEDIPPNCETFEESFDEDDDEETFDYDNNEQLLFDNRKR